MDFLEWRYLGNSVQTWLIAVGLGLVVLIGLRVIQGLAFRKVSARASKTRNELDDLAAELIRKTRYFLPLVIALYAGVQPLSLPPTADRIFRALVVIGLILQGVLWGDTVISQWITRHMQRRMEEDAAAATTIGALRFVTKLALWTIALLLALENVGVDVTALVTGLGIGGIAVALALQNVLSDLFASLSIVFDKPFVIGDFIIVGDMLGTVEHIGLKTTRIRSLSGEQLVFSNSDLLSSRIRNYKRMFERRIVFSFGVVYQTPYEKLAGIPGTVREIIESQENARFDRAHFKAYGDSSLDFEVVYYVLLPDYNIYMDIQQAINLELYRRFEEQGIDFAYPTRTLYLQSQQPAPALS